MYDMAENPMQEQHKPSKIYEMVIEPPLPEQGYNSNESWDEDEGINMKNGSLNGSVNGSSKNGGAFNESTLNLLHKVGVCFSVCVCFWSEVVICIDVDCARESVYLYMFQCCRVISWIKRTIIIVG